MALCIVLAALTGVGATSGEGGSSGPLVSPTLLAELDARVLPNEIDGHSGLAIARLRPGARVVLDPRTRFDTAIEFAAESPIILDAAATFDLWASPDLAVDLVAGLSKPPLFASFLLEPEGTGALIEGSPVVAGFGLRRELGGTLHAAWANVPLEVWGRVGNGSGSPVGNDNGALAYSAMADLVLGRPWRGAAPGSRWMGVRVGAAFMTERAEAREGISGRTPLGYTYAPAGIVDGRRTVLSAHAIGYVGALRIVVEGALADEARTRDDDGNVSTPRIPLPDVRSSGVTGELAYVLWGAPRTVGRAPGSIGGDAPPGALELAARGDALFLGRDARDVRSNGGYTLAAAARFFAAEGLALAIGGDLTQFDRPPLESPDRTNTYTITFRGTLRVGAESQRTNP